MEQETNFKRLETKKLHFLEITIISEIGNEDKVTMLLNPKDLRVLSKLSTELMNLYQSLGGFPKSSEMR